MSSSQARRKATPTDPLPRTFYTPREVAASIGLSYETVLGLVKTGEIPSIRPGHQYLIPATALAELQKRAS